ncbi:MAG: Ku protein [Sporichthyaceae bacterium]|nr:Ku protein [Sporichthyaceae bacterium]
MPQTIWKGAISFGLVTIPVKLYAATEERGVSLHQVHIADGGRIRYRRICEADGDEVPYRDIGRGYQLPDGDTIVLTEEDMANLPLASSRSVEVLQFVDSDNIDPINFSRSYYLEPDGPGGKPYVLLRDALRRTDKVAVVKVALRSRESLATLRPVGDVLVLQMMLWPDEVRDARAFAPGDDVEVRAQEVAMAESYIATLSGEFDPTAYTDAYREALMEVIEAKAAGRPVREEATTTPAPGEVVDLMDALRRSVEDAKRRRGESGSEPESGGRKAPAKKVPAAKTTKTAPASKAPAKKPAAKRTAAKKTARKATKKAPAKEPDKGKPDGSSRGKKKSA